MKYILSSPLYFLQWSRNNDVDKGSEKLKIQLDEIKEVYEKFTAKSAAGFSGRLSYDIQCDVLKNNWRDLKQYNQREAVQQFQRKMSAVKRKDTLEKKKEMTNLDKCVYLFKQNGSQETEFKMAVHRAITEKIVFLMMSWRRILNLDLT